MKIKTVLFTVLMILAIAAGVFADNEITYFTCDSDPADFNGKTFEDLAVMIDGCVNFDSTIIPGKDSFVTLDNITVNGYLYFVDDSYDPITGTSVDASFDDISIHGDTYLNITGLSNINNVSIQCVYSHNCNLGLQYPASIFYMEQALVNQKSLGKTIIRGYIDPFVDSETDYYHDTFVKNFPDFNIETFDVDFVSLALQNYSDFNYAALGSVEFGKNLMYPYGTYSFLASETVSEELAKLFKRGNIELFVTYNSAGQNIGDFELDLANITIEDFFILPVGFENNGYGKETSYLGSNWKPNIVSRGYTTIGSFNANMDFSTDVYTPGSYSIDSTDPETAVLPLYVDLMILGGTGRTVEYDMNQTRIVMLNYIGNEDPGSKLVLNMGKLGTSINMPTISVANIIGGKLDFSCKETTHEVPSIDSLKLYEGIADYSYDDSAKGRYEPLDTWESLYYSDDARIDDVYTYNMIYLPENKTYAENTSTATLRNHRNDLYNNEILKLSNFARTDHGYFEIAATLDGMIVPTETDKIGNSVTKLYVYNTSLGDITVSMTLGEQSRWFDPKCNFWQYGEFGKLSTRSIDYTAVK